MKYLSIVLFFIILITKNSYAQPCTDIEELFRKRHQVDGMTYGHPYTTFDRHNENYIDLDYTLEKIRKRIIQESPDDVKGPIFKAYQTLYSKAVESMPGDNGMPKDGISNLALWSKNNAFVFLVGLDGDGNYMDTHIYSGHTTASFDKRNEFRDRAVNAFDHLIGEIDKAPTNPWLLAIPIVGAHVYAATYLNDEQDYLGKIQNQCRSLTLWLQSYDLIKAEYASNDLRFGIAPRCKWGFGDYDRNDYNCSPRNKMRQLTKDLYYYSKGNFGIVEHKYGWKKNRYSTC